MKLEVRIATELLVIDTSLSQKYYETLFKWVNKMKVYAKGCDAPGCAQEAEVDANLGRPVGWYFISLDGGEPCLSNTVGPRISKKTIVVCPTCFTSSGLVRLTMPPGKP